jgi:hypothetical protein
MASKLTFRESSASSSSIILTYWSSGDWLSAAWRDPKYCGFDWPAAIFQTAGKHSVCRSQWPRGLRPGSAAARFLRLWVRIPPNISVSFCCECCVLSGRGLCDGLITRLEESYWVRVCVCVCVWLWPRNLNNEGALAWVLSTHEKKLYSWFKVFAVF